MDQALKKIEEEENEEQALKDKVISKSRKEAKITIAALVWIIYRPLAQTSAFR